MTGATFSVTGIAPVLPVPSLEEAVRFWSVALGAAPTFVDGTRWAQFDVAARRLSLSCEDGGADRAGLMVKVDDLDAARAALTNAGFALGPVETGAHEVRCSGTAPGGWLLVLYAPLPG